jgi:hypothetical protein
MAVFIVFGLSGFAAGGDAAPGIAAGCENYVLATVSTGTGCGSSATAISQLQPSRMQARKTPLLLRFSTINGAPHFGHGSMIGWLGVVKSHSG